MEYLLYTQILRNLALVRFLGQKETLKKKKNQRNFKKHLTLFFFVYIWYKFLQGIWNERLYNCWGKEYKEINYSAMPLWMFVLA